MCLPPFLHAVLQLFHADCWLFFLRRGSNLISVYATVIFQTNLGMSSENARALTGGALTWKFLSSFIAFFTIDRLGRRAVFMISGAGMASCMVALAICTSFGAENKSAQIVAGYVCTMLALLVIFSA